MGEPAIMCMPWVRFFKVPSPTRSLGDGIPTIFICASSETTNDVAGKDPGISERLEANQIFFFRKL
jgi:hypothetical protein